MMECFGELDPDFLEHLEVVFEFLNRVVLRDVVLLELLDDDQYEEVQHDVLNDHYEDEEVESTQATAACGWAAVRFRMADIIHDQGPVFAS